MPTHAEPNAAQVDRWNGEEGRHWVAEADRYDVMTMGFGDAVIGAAGLAPGERILDVGCGTGSLTIEAAQRIRPGGAAIGIDVSAPMLDLARRRAAGHQDEVEFLEADAQVYPFEEGQFDKIISRFGVMFFDDPRAAFANLARALVHGGRLVFTAWQGLVHSEWILVPGSAAAEHVGFPEGIGDGDPGPFGLADPDRTREILLEAGFVDVNIASVTRSICIGHDVDDALEFIRAIPLVSGLLDRATPEETDAAVGAARKALLDHVTPGGVVMNDNRAWLVTAERRPSG